MRSKRRVARARAGSLTKCFGPEASAVMNGRFTSVEAVLESSILAFSAACRNIQMWRRRRQGGVRRMMRTKVVFRIAAKGTRVSGAQRCAFFMNGSEATDSPDARLAEALDGELVTPQVDPAGLLELINEVVLHAMGGEEQGTVRDAAGERGDKQAVAGDVRRAA